MIIEKVGISCPFVFSSSFLFLKNLISLRSTYRDFFVARGLIRGRILDRHIGHFNAKALLGK